MAPIIQICRCRTDVSYIGRASQTFRKLHTFAPDIYVALRVAAQFSDTCTGFEIYSRYADS